MILNKSKDDWTHVMGINTAQEISQQPETWAKTVGIIKHQYQEIHAFIESITKQDHYKIIFSGAGTSEFVGNALVPLFQKAGNDHFVSIASTDLVATPEYYIRENQPTLVVSFGRSGNSPESIGAIDVANAINKNTKHLIITCNKDGALALRKGEHYASIILPDETNDLSFAMTSSFTNMLLAAYLCFNLDKGIINQFDIASLQDAAHHILNDFFPIAQRVVDTFDFKRIVYLGDASLNGIAQESALKILELTAGEVVSMFNSPLGFRHGPKSILNQETLTVIYLSDDPYTRQYQIDIIKEISSQRDGNQLIAIDCKQDRDIEVLVDEYFAIHVEATTKDLIGLCYIIVAQMIGLLRSVSLGKSPDNPWPSGMVNRVVQGVTLYPFDTERGKV